MSLTHALLIDGVILWISGFLVGIGLKTIIDGFAKRDDYERRFEGIEGRVEAIEEDLAELDEVWNPLVDTVDAHTDWIDGIEGGDEVEPDSGVEPDANLPPYGDYHRFVSPPVTNE